MRLCRQMAVWAAAALALGAPAVRAASPAPAVTVAAQSAETDLDLTACTIASSNDLETRWACPGYKGIPVYVGKASLHFYVSFGLKSTEEKAARQSLPPANALGDKIEWRLSNRSGRWTPFAAIVPFRLQDDAGKPGVTVLVVLRLGEGTTCQMAYVDATANADAVKLARQAADAHGFDFDCRKDPVIVGRFAAWPR